MRTQWLFKFLVEMDEQGPISIEPLNPVKIEKEKDEEEEEGSEE